VLGRSIHALHVLGAVLWADGMNFAPRPALAELKSSARPALHEGALRRFFLMVRHAMPAPLPTGWALLFFCTAASAAWVGTSTSGTRRGWRWRVFSRRCPSGRGAASAPSEGGRPAGRGGRRGAGARLVTVSLALGLSTMAVAAWGRFGG